MKVAYILGTFPSVSETFILREMTELRRQGIDVRVFALRRPAGGAVPAEAEALLPVTRYRPAFLGMDSLAALFLFLWRHPWRLATVLGRALATAWGEPLETLKRLRHVATAAYFAREASALGVEHIHAHFAFMPTDVAAMMAELTGLGFSFSAHASDIHLQPPGALARKIRAARFVAVCTRYGREEIGRHVDAQSMEKVQLIYHGVPLAQPGEDVHPDRPRAEPLVLAVGRLQPKKGFATLIEAARILRDRGVAFHCVIAGEGPERKTLEAALDRLRLRERVHLAGECTQSELGKLFRSARVFVLPCIIAPDGDRDGLPNVILEALAAGVPVVTTPVAGIPEVIEEGRTGLLAPAGDAPALAARIEELLKNETLCRRMAVLGRSVVEEQFNLARNVTPLIERFTRMRSSL
jgi:glycosyltransferase involved in cell wall biosynthesis